MKALSYQLYSSRNFGPLRETLTMLAAAGYAQVEGYGGLFAQMSQVAALKADLDASGLTMPSGHFGLDMVEGDPAQVIEIAKTLGIAHVFVPYLDAADRPSDAAGWRAFGARLSAAGAPLRDAGLSFGWHNHDFEFAGPGGSYPIDALLEGGPDLAFEFDVAWAVRAGADPLPVIDRYGDRILAAHVKDIAPAGEATDEDGWADVGAGTMPWDALLAKLTAAGCTLFVAEHDNPSDDTRFAKRSFANIQGM